jgi:hypothetical protein
MGIWRGFLVVFVALSVLSGCASDPIPLKKKDYTEIRSESVRSILVVPVINNTVDVDAPDYFLSTVSVPLAEHGYYVFPVNLVKRVMEEEGLADANLVHSADPTRLGELYGADAILYITIENWETTYLVVAAETTVSFNYVLKSGRTGEVLWQEQSTESYSAEVESTGDDDDDGVVDFLAYLVVMSVVSAIEKAAPDYISLAQEANRKAIHNNRKDLPTGPYSWVETTDSE